MSTGCLLETIHGTVYVSGICTKVTTSSASWLQDSYDIQNRDFLIKAYKHYTHYCIISWLLLHEMFIDNYIKIAFSN